MKVLLKGKQHIEGTSRKTGKPFSNTVVYIEYPDMQVEGVRSETLWLDPVMYPLNSLIVNEEYNLEYNNRGYVAGFTLCE